MIISFGSHLLPSPYVTKEKPRESKAIPFLLSLFLLTHGNNLNIKKKERTFYWTVFMENTLGHFR